MAKLVVDTKRIVQDRGVAKSREPGVYIMWNNGVCNVMYDADRKDMWVKVILEDGSEVELTRAQLFEFARRL